ncbi:hypothetical protein GAPWK_1378 [Gilliamella apicola]|nr:hypothetical protein GAPWK_1378 [Gilliamella apicola]
MLFSYFILVGLAIQYLALVRYQCDLLALDIFSIQRVIVLLAH